MLTVHSNEHHRHDGKFELSSGALVPCYECPQRADLVLAAVQQAGLGEVIAPQDFGLAPLHRLHDARFVEFLAEAWDLWVAAGHQGDALPQTWAIRGMRSVEPESIDGKLAFFSFDAGTPIMSGTWQAARAAANVALTGASRLLDGEHCVFALCRPPGHHAAVDYYGGYCFLNNAAIAAQYLRDNGARKVAILDIDYHHGNGTQSIFYDRSDVLFVSIHGDPAQEYPYFLGRSDETGEGDGAGYNLNIPLRWQTSAETWLDALDTGCERIAAFAPDSLVVSLGVDTYIRDPISQFRLTSEDYLKVGARIAKPGLPMLFVLEGGYAVADIGINVANVLTGAAGQ